ncbi:LAMI_0E01750g1_1 [Lachancea mirantina]|uniref:U3 small nucleolar RNA-associated protein 22 n=1 Tax=Lachancea mirantina TaxID=1230905 RepID=A0A1G4JJ40_9SACH|nr:LAMI_0E01750g1_1 [Lachancea mirantina]
MASLKRGASDAIKYEESGLRKKALIDTISSQTGEKDVHFEGGNGSESEDTRATGSGKDEDDDEHDDDDSSAEGHEDGVPQARHAVKKIGAQDIQIARETAELFKSNIFKLQIDELLQQVKLKDSHILKVEKFMHKLYDMIQRIPEWGSHTISEVETYFKGKIVTVPFVEPRPTASTKYKFEYKTPDVSLIGSFALKAVVYQPEGSSVDILLTMPESLFEKKDFMNFKCIHKRSVYLAYFTHHLSLLLADEKLSDLFHLEYAYFNGDSLNPILNIKCKPDAASSDYNFYKTKFSINLMVGFPYGVFDAKKLRPNKNCIRIQDDKETRTPFYNFSVLSATTYDHYLKFLYKTKKQTEAFKDACMLGRLWIKQRGFTSDISYCGKLGGFGPFEFATLMSALLSGGGVNGNKILLHGFSSYQLFKGVIKYLATMDLCSEGHLQFYSEIDSSATVPTSRYIEEGFQTPTIFDKTTKVNILNKMSLSCYQTLKLYAQGTYRNLNDTLKDQFSNIFLTNLNKVSNLKYDICFDLLLPTDSVLQEQFGPVEKIRFINLENFVVNKISNVMKIALGERILSFEIELLNRHSSFPISRRKPSGGANISNIRIKILVNPTEHEKLLTRGPVNSDQNSPEVLSFKSFWGKKSSLRRFKDGTITHCCVWPTSASEPVIVQILSYVFKLHLAEDAIISGQTLKQFHELLPLPNLPASSSTSITNLGSYLTLKKSFEDFHKVIFGMQLPLTVKSLLPVGSAFRYTTLCQPVPFAFSSPDFFQDVILEFESTPKWPDEVSSLEKAKAAFLLKIKEQLDSGKYKSFFIRDESIPYNLEVLTLNVLTPDGFGFRIRVLTERDEVLYLRAISNARNELKPELERTFLKFTAKYLTSVRHTRTIENVSHGFPLYSPVVRLFKKWLDCHLLLGHLPEELVETLAMKPFVDASPYLPSASLENGFLKIIAFLSEWNWREDPLVLDLVRPSESEEHAVESSIDAKKFSESLTLSQYKTMESNFSTLRKNDPQGFHVQFFVGSRIDPSGILYSSSVPLPIATRLTALSKVAMTLIKNHGLNKQTIDLLFTPALKDYDFVVKLQSPVALKLSSGVLDSQGYKNLSEQPTGFPSDLSQLSEKMDPTLQLIKYLNLKYRNSIIFSSHQYMAVNGGFDGSRNVITGLIKPLFKTSQRFKVNIDANIEPVDDVQVQLNKEAIFHEIAAFGQDFVTAFEVN